MHDPILDHNPIFEEIKQLSSAHSNFDFVDLPDPKEVSLAQVSAPNEYESRAAQLTDFCKTDEGRAELMLALKEQKFEDTSLRFLTIQALLPHWEYDSKVVTYALKELVGFHHLTLGESVPSQVGVYYRELGNFVLSNIDEISKTHKKPLRDTLCQMAVNVDYEDLVEDPLQLKLQEFLKSFKDRRVSKLFRIKVLFAEKYSHNRGVKKLHLLNYLAGTGRVLDLVAVENAARLYKPDYQPTSIGVQSVFYGVFSSILAGATLIFGIVNLTNVGMAVCFIAGALYARRKLLEQRTNQQNSGVSYRSMRFSLNAMKLLRELGETRKAAKAAYKRVLNDDSLPTALQERLKKFDEGKTIEELCPRSYEIDPDEFYREVT